MKVRLGDVLLEFYTYGYGYHRTVHRKQIIDKQGKTRAIPAESAMSKGADQLQLLCEWIIPCATQGLNVRPDVKILLSHKHCNDTNEFHTLLDLLGRTHNQHVVLVSSDVYQHVVRRGASLRFLEHDERTEEEVVYHFGVVIPLWRSSCSASF